MRLTMTAIGFALAAAAASPALAQTAAAPAPAAKEASDLCPTTISNGARKGLIEVQAAVNSKDRAAIAAKVAAARASAKTPADKCILAQFELKAAADATDFASASSAIDGVMASGVANTPALGPLVLNLGKLRYQAKDYAGATANFEKAMTLMPTNGEPIVLLAEARAKMGRVDDALMLFKKAAAVEAGAGRKVEESWIKRGVGIAYDSKSTQTYALSRDWIAAYPTSKNWRDGLRIFGVLSNMPETDMIDVYRLQRATKSLASESDYALFAQAALDKGLPGEAAAVLNEGIAANAISRSSSVIKMLLGQATTRASGDRAGLAAQAKTALAGGTAKSAMGLGDAYLGYGDYAQGAALYRAALGKPGVDLNLANLRLGMALAMAGDKAGARTALEAVTGAKSELAKYWLTYSAVRA